MKITLAAFLRGPENWETKWGDSFAEEGGFSDKLVMEGREYAKWVRRGAIVTAPHLYVAFAWSKDILALGTSLCIL